jgi:ECF sigma factor
MKPIETSSKANAVTQLLMNWKAGSKEALDSLTPIVYDELCLLADQYLRDERAASTLQPN